ncbi:SnoaL-like domain-containing protein [Lentibacillus persicus]|uniref:SnoaL-like domain-containing protein n=1 Tax=Lentibacillus persicus TaxID=640948 RepID=A0A1I1X9W1_9BACI|nr:nuclear transport factor 2 family protein [Lentibacillus persicus]SFE04206.1 SnoaL-like domain-containing protein [Lentibacillus persicus]
MTNDIKIVCPEDCGNSPKKEILKQVTIAFAANDTDIIDRMFADNAVWEIVGDKTIDGKNDMIASMKNNNTAELHIANIITHGKTGAVNGTVINKDGKRIAFCEIYNFSSAGKKAKIKETRSYFINL